MSSKMESLGLPQLCAVKSAPVTGHIPLRLVRAVSESPVCMMMAERDKSI